VLKISEPKVVEQTKKVIQQNTNTDNNSPLPVLRKYFIIIPGHLNYGPYFAEELYPFLYPYKNNEDDHHFMVADSEFDIYYNPKLAFEFIAKEVQARQNLDEINALLEKASKGVKTELLDHTASLNFHERRLREGVHPKSKFDMFDKFRNAQYLPIRHVDSHLGVIKYLKGNKNNLNPMNNKTNINFSINPITS